ncbi:MAG TPA: hypothetical protein VKA21_02685 [Candidatus Binatia bacterium]|nr:hypothetical protein [Candidatus Binatia bacterium]
MRTGWWAVVLGCALAAGVAWADRQRIAPGTALQSEVVVDSGPNGICETTARGDDLQATPVGAGAPFENAVRCGADRVATSVAAGDDRQLIALGADCQNPGTAVIDTGADGIASSPAVGDDVQLIAVGAGAARSDCVIAGANGLADTPDPVGGDDGRLIPVGTALPNAVVVRCGPNRIVETHANNVNASGDDVQLVAPGGACQNANTPVVDSGANGIADTRAEGSDLLLRLAQRSSPIRLVIRPRRGSVSKTVKLLVSNVEFGAAPPTRPYQLVVDNGSCPRGTVVQVDANTGVRDVQGFSDVAKGKRVKGSFVVTFGLEDVTSVDRKIPFRCAVQVEAQSLDTAPTADDASNTANNATEVEFEVVDQSDL